ncbi:tyrosine-type recombinase/integrase, partial [Planctomycetota bacterium]
LDSIIADYEIWLRITKGKNGFRRSEKHISNTMSKIRAIVNGCKFRTWDDIRKSAVETYLGRLSISTGYYNLFVQAIKQFCRWCVRENKAEYSPVQFLERLSMPDEEKRQALSYEAVCRLLTATAKAPDRYGMSGLERAILYIVAVQSGLRANELRHLTVGDFDAKKATLTLKAEYCKDRRGACQFITLALASHLSDYIDGRDGKDPLFGMWSQRTAEMIKADAIDAGLPLIDDKGRELVFHSTRHTLRTELVRCRISESIIDRILRHKPQGIGQRIYTHVSPFEIRAAIEKLPAYPWPGDIQKAEKAKVS